MEKEDQEAGEKAQNKVVETNKCILASQRGDSSFIFAHISYANNGGKTMTISLIICIYLASLCIALIVPFTPLGAFFKFVEPLLEFFIILAGLISIYLLLVNSLRNDSISDLPNLFGTSFDRQSQDYI